MTGTPSTLADLLAECDTYGIRLIPVGDGSLTIDAPQDALTPDLLARLKAHKAELLDFVERIEERAAIMEFDGGLNRQQAERLAWLGALQMEQQTLRWKHGPKETETETNQLVDRPVAAGN